MSEKTEETELFEKQQKGNRLRSLERDEGLKQLMATKAGRTFMHSLLEQTGPTREAFTGNSGTFYNLGMACIGRRLLNELLDKHMDQFKLMMQEAKLKPQGQ